MARPSLHLSGEPRADALLSEDPLALLIGMVLDQQIPLEWAFRGPAELVDRLSLATPLDAHLLSGMDPDVLAEAFSRRPALHRYPSSMAARVQALCRTVVDEYGGDGARLWTEAPDGKQLTARVKALPGFGDQKARIFVALLGKQFGVRPTGWEAASAPFGEPGSHRSVADIVDGDSLARVREWKQAAKAQAKSAHVAAAASSGGGTRGVANPKGAAKRGGPMAQRQG